MNHGALAILAGSLLAIACAGCGGEAERWDPPPEDTTTPCSGGSCAVEGATRARPECEDGEERSCIVELTEHEGVITCFRGLRSCIEGRWAECGTHGDAGPETATPAPVDEEGIAE
jgi:hypothetical protein